MRRIVLAGAIAVAALAAAGAQATTATTPSGQGCAVVNATNTTDSCVFTIGGGGFTATYDQGVGGVYTGSAQITHLFTTGGTQASGPADNKYPYIWNAAASQWQYLKIYWSGSGFGPFNGACKTCFSPYNVNFDIGIPLTLTLSGQGFIAAGSGE